MFGAPYQIRAYWIFLRFTGTAETPTTPTHGTSAKIGRRVASGWLGIARPIVIVLIIVVGAAETPAG